MTRPPNCKNVHFIPNDVELLTIDLAELSGGDLRKSEKNLCGGRQVGQTACRLESKARILNRSSRRHRFTVRHPACDLYPLTSDPGCRTALQTGKETHDGPENDGRDPGAPAKRTLGRGDPGGGRGNGGLRTQPQIVPSGVHVACDGRDPLQELWNRRDGNDRRVGRCHRSFPSPSSEPSMLGFSRRRQPRRRAARVPARSQLDRGAASEVETR